MSAFVVDASMTLAWCFSDERTEAATAVLDRLMYERAIVSHFWSMEVSNALLMSERRGRLASERTRETLKVVNSLNIQQDDVPDVARVDEIAELARQERLTVYDACYLSIAIRLRIPLASLDAELCAAARRRSVGVLG